MKLSLALVLFIAGLVSAAGGRRMIADTSNEIVVAAAKHYVDTINKGVLLLQNPPTIQLYKVVSAEYQIVSGVKYFLLLKLMDSASNSFHSVDVTVLCSPGGEMEILASEMAEDTSVMSDSYAQTETLEASTISRGPLHTPFGDEDVESGDTSSKKKGDSTVALIVTGVVAGLVSIGIVVSAAMLVLRKKNDQVTYERVPISTSYEPPSVV